jgi:glutathione synthase/RimK-type ligase-like ATP-grasp enzyme
VSLDGADGYCFEVRDGSRTAVFAAGAGSPYALNNVRAASVARDKAFCAEALRRAGVPVIEGRMFFSTERWAEMRNPGREPRDARRYVRASAFPVFCKPISASNGLFAEIVESPEAFDAYLERVAEKHFAILIQPYVRAPEYRVFVLDGVVLFSYRKRLPELRGDGASTVQQLAASHGQAAARVLDSDGHALSKDAVLAPGAIAILEGPANRSAGGGASEFREGADEELAALALSATRALRLRIAGVDMFAPPDRAPFVIEVNSNPMIATLEDHSRWDLIETIWRANFDAALQ